MTDKIDVKKYEFRATHEIYVHRAAAEIDKAVNVIFLGKPGQTISSRALQWKIGAVPKPYWWKRWAGSAGVWVLDRFQKNHGVLANIGDYAKAEAMIATAKKTLEMAGIPQEEL